MVKCERGRLQMENKELPSEEKAIMVWPDVQSNAKNSVSHTKKKQKAFHLLPIHNGLTGVEWKRSSCMLTIPLFCVECCERGAKSRANGEKGTDMRQTQVEFHSNFTSHHPKVVLLKSFPQKVKPQCQDGLENTLLSWEIIPAILNQKKIGIASEMFV